MTVIEFVDFLLLSFIIYGFYLLAYTVLKFIFLLSSQIYYKDKILKALKLYNITQLRFDTCPKIGGFYLYRVNNINLPCSDYDRNNKAEWLKRLDFHNHQTKDDFKTALLLNNMKEEAFFLNLEQFYSFMFDLAYLPYLSSTISYEQDEFLFELKPTDPFFILGILINKLESDFYFLTVRVLKLKLLIDLASKLR